jgi:hypothetical protein
MRCTGWLTVVAIAAVVWTAGGCEEPAMRSARKSSSAPQTQPASDSTIISDALPAVATRLQGSDAQPANAFLTIDGKITEFPPARLRVTKTDEGVQALLFSDDPRNATSAEYKGNSFYFDISLRIADTSEVGRADYFYKADNSEPSESPNGVFLNGTKFHLQPQDVAITFDGAGRKVMAQVAGRFLVVRTTGENVPGQVAAVQGTLYTTVEIDDER